MAEIILVVFYIFLFSCIGVHATDHTIPPNEHKFQQYFDQAQDGDTVIFPYLSGGYSSNTSITITKSITVIGQYNDLSCPEPFPLFIISGSINVSFSQWNLQTLPHYPNCYPWITATNGTKIFVSDYATPFPTTFAGDQNIEFQLQNSALFLKNCTFGKTVLLESTFHGENCTAHGYVFSDQDTPVVLTGDWQFVSTVGGSLLFDTYGNLEVYDATITASFANGPFVSGQFFAQVGGACNITNTSFLAEPSPEPPIVAIIFGSSTVLEGVTVRGWNGQDYGFGGAAFRMQGKVAINNCVFDSIIDDTGDEKDSGDAAALLIQNGADVTVSNTIFSNNYIHYGRGAGCFITGTSNVTFHNTTFYNNEATDGAGCHVTGGSNVSFYNTTFSRNWALQNGAGCYANDSTVSFFNCTFFDNLSNFGSAIYTYNSNVFINNVVMEQSSAITAGAGMVIDGNGKMTILSNCTIRNNTSGAGAAIGILSGQVLIDSSTITNNTSISSINGAIHIYDGDTILIANSTITESVPHAITLDSNTTILVIRNSEIEEPNNTLPGNYCCSSDPTNSPNNQICNFPACTATCEEAVGCNCPYEPPSGSPFPPALTRSEFQCTCEGGFGGLFCDECRTGYNGTTCSDINECSSADLNNCSSIADCINTDGGFQCACKPGYTGDGFNCSDLDECATGKNNCSNLATCVNKIGSYDCICKNNSIGVPEVSFNVTKPCSRGKNGKVSFVVSNFSTNDQTKPASYSFGGVLQDGNVFSGIAASSYIWKVYDSYRCSIGGVLPVFDSASLIPVVLRVVDHSCAPGSGYAYLSASGGSGSGYMISLNDGPWTSVWNYSSLAQGPYSFSVEDSLGCQNSSSFVINGVANDCACPPGQGRNPHGDCVNLCDLPTKFSDCSVCNGGCDFRVSCSDPNGTIACGFCPVGTESTNSSDCASRCGNGICEPDIFENCVTCVADCGAAACNVCGDGECTAAIGETCPSCPLDCCVLECPSGCNGHGTCNNGICKCDANWTGPTCKTDATLPINITSQNSTNPNVTLNSKFSIALRSLGEVDAQGRAVRYYSVPDRNFSLATNDLGSNTTYNYTTILDNGAAISFVITQYSTTEVDFANVSVYTNRALAIRNEVHNWPFTQSNNSLKVEMSVIANAQPIGSVCSDDNDETGLQWVMINQGGATLYGVFDNNVDVDGRTQRITYKLSDMVVSAVLPHFWNYTLLDSRYSVIVDADQLCSEIAPPKRSHKTSKTTKIAISVGVIGGLIILVLIILSVQRVMIFWKHHKLKRVNSSIEMETFSNPNN